MRLKCGACGEWYEDEDECPYCGNENVGEVEET